MVSVNLGVGQLGFHRALFFQHRRKFFFQRVVLALQRFDFFVQGIAFFALFAFEALLFLARKVLRQSLLRQSACRALPGGCAAGCAQGRYAGTVQADGEDYTVFSLKIKGGSADGPNCRWPRISGRDPAASADDPDTAGTTGENELMNQFRGQILRITNVKETGCMRCHPCL